MYYMSLAFADLLIGSIAMPLNVYLHIMCDFWPFSSFACDLFICFDVLASTASIIHLCVIAVDRYSVIDDPLGYVSRLSRRRVFGSILGIWLASTAISFPGIAWWKFAGMSEHRIIFTDAVTHHNYLECHMTNEVTYIFVSSAVSFYIPLIIMSFVYYKIYQKAVAQSRFLTCGSKKIQLNDSMKRNQHPHHQHQQHERITLRAHRGGQHLALSAAAAVQNASVPRLQLNENLNRSPINEPINSIKPIQHSPPPPPPPPPVSAPARVSMSIRSAYRKNVARKASIFSYQKSFTFFQKLRAILKEHKAARTLGLVMGVFILCWLPFFVLNILSAVVPSITRRTAFKPVFKTFTWCGYMNSGKIILKFQKISKKIQKFFFFLSFISVLNPFLYGVSNRTFRNIYMNFLTCGRSGSESPNKKKSSKSIAISSDAGRSVSKSKSPFKLNQMQKDDQETLEASLRQPQGIRRSQSPVVVKMSIEVESSSGITMNVVEKGRRTSPPVKTVPSIGSNGSTPKVNRKRKPSLKEKIERMQTPPLDLSLRRNSRRKLVMVTSTDDDDGGGGGEIIEFEAGCLVDLFSPLESPVHTQSQFDLDDLAESPNHPRVGSGAAGPFRRVSSRCSQCRHCACRRQQQQQRRPLPAHGGEIELFKNDTTTDGQFTSVSASVQDLTCHDRCSEITAII